MGLGVGGWLGLGEGVWPPTAAPERTGGPPGGPRAPFSAGRRQDGGGRGRRGRCVIPNGPSVCPSTGPTGTLQGRGPVGGPGEVPGPPPLTSTCRTSWDWGSVPSPNPKGRTGGYQPGAGARVRERGLGCHPTNMSPADKVPKGTVRQSVPVPSLQVFYSEGAPPGGSEGGLGLDPLRSTCRTSWDWGLVPSPNPKG